MRPALTYSARAILSAHLPTECMKKDLTPKSSDEPLGIIISQGDKREPTPVYSAYIWAPAPEVPTKKAVRAA